MCLCVSVCISMHVCMYVCPFLCALYMCVFSCIHKCVYICAYTYKYTCNSCALCPDIQPLPWVLGGARQHCVVSNLVSHTCRGRCP